MSDAIKIYSLGQNVYLHTVWCALNSVTFRIYAILQPFHALENVLTLSGVGNDLCGLLFGGHELFDSLALRRHLPVVRMMVILLLISGTGALTSRGVSHCPRLIVHDSISVAGPRLARAAGFASLRAVMRLLS